MLQSLTPPSPTSRATTSSTISANPACATSCGRRGWPTAARSAASSTPGSRWTTPTQFNSYTTDMVKGVILAFRAASNARDVNCVVFTGTGDKAFCTGGNTKEYAEYYAGQPQEYRQYMRLFNDMVSAILACDKPVVCRVNGMRIGGGQEIGMACDFSIAQDLARFGQAGPKHGSAPIGGATDFLPPMIGNERAMVAGVLCEPFSAHKAYHWGILADIVPCAQGRRQLRRQSAGRDATHCSTTTAATCSATSSGRRGGRGGKALIARGTVDLSLLDADGRGAVREAAAHLPRLHDQDARGAAQAQARRLEPQQGELARVARAQHDDRGTRRLHRVQRRRQERSRGRLRAAAPAARRRARAGWVRCTTRSSPRARPRL